MDPKGPAQPNIDTAYDTAGNPADKTSDEQSQAAANASTNTGATAEQRGQGDIPVPSTHDDGATPSSLGIGVRDTNGDKGESVGLPRFSDYPPVLIIGIDFLPEI